MENYEIRNDDMVIEVADEIIAKGPNKGLIATLVTVGAVVAGTLLYTKVIKPRREKNKAKKELEESGQQNDTVKCAEEEYEVK